MNVMLDTYDFDSSVLAYMSATEVSYRQNITSTTTEVLEVFSPATEILRIVFLAGSLGFVALVTAVGNLFVLITILMERHLHRPQNYLIISLACADMTVGLGVLPLSTLYEITSHRWIFGSSLCEIWMFTDMSACSASILNMVAIALDRYWSIADIRYSHQRRVRRIFMVIATVWIVSLLISLLPIVGWKDRKYRERIENQTCLISQEPSFQIFSTTGAFYAPLVVIVSVYVAVYRAARSRIRRRTSSIISAADSSDLIKPPSVQIKLTAPFANDCYCSHLTAAQKKTSSVYLPVVRIEKPEMPEPEPLEARIANVDETTQLKLRAKRGRRKASLEQKRERKLFHTLAIVTGTFIVCWLPFFVTALVRPFCGCSLNDTLDAIFQWLGWSNSMLNPVIYTVFSPDFRKSFQKIVRRLCGCFLGNQKRPGGATHKQVQPIEFEQKKVIVVRHSPDSEDDLDDSRAL